jgi:TolB protein
MFSLQHITRRDAITALFTILGASPLSAQINAGDTREMSIVVPDFFGQSPDELEKGRDVAVGIASNLRNSGRFTLLDPAKYAVSVTKIDVMPKFDVWRAVSAGYLVVGLLSHLPDGRFKVQFRLWDVMAAQQLYGAVYFFSENQLRRVPHIIADSIYEHVTGQAGRFDDEKKN